jgi:predicted nuclease with RNAse H fold
MITLGIDLASQPENTAACVISWGDERPRVVRFEPCCDDALLDELITAAEAIGIDSPFGWPEPFVLAMKKWNIDHWDNELRDAMTLRRTDRVVHEVCGLRPLRVAADRIALPALRCMALLQRHGVTDRSGSPASRFSEVYPAGSLRQWGLLSRPSYRGKSEAARQQRIRITRRLAKQFRLGNASRAGASDHQLDAMIASITARLAHQRLSIPPAPQDREAAVREGWIHLPRP